MRTTFKSQKFLVSSRIPIRQRRRDAGGFVAYTSILLFSFILLSMLLSFSFINILLIKKSQETNAGSTWGQLIGREGSVTCADARNLVQNGTWVDPNQGQEFSRKLITDPQYFMAVHNRGYDPVRYETIYNKGKYYEDQVHARFLQILRSDIQGARIPVVLDVGANIGYYTLLSMTLGYPVLAFEINPPNLLRLCESLALNGLALPEKDSDEYQPGRPMVRLYQRGVSDTDGQDLEVWVPKNAGQAYMKQKGIEQDQQRGYHDHVQTITLDSYAFAHGWLVQRYGGIFANPSVQVKILKIDVEGKEPLVLQGAKDLLASGIVENVLTEFRRLARPNVQLALQILLQCQYALVDEQEGKVSIDRSRVLLDELTKELTGKEKTVDLFFQRIDLQ